MSKRKNSTKEEREKCIQDFLASGSTQRTWCEENDVSLATFRTWLAEYKSTHQETKFIPLSAKNKSNPSYIPKPQEILIEIGACKIHVSEQAGLQLIIQAIKRGEKYGTGIICIVRRSSYRRRAKWFSVINDGRGDFSPDGRNL